MAFGPLESLLNSFDKKRECRKLKIGGIDAKLYLPKSEGPHPVVLFNQGLVSGSGIGIANFFSRYLTGLGVAVMVPVYKGHLTDSFVVEDTEHVIEIFKYLQSLDDIDSTKIGMLGLSYGGLLSLVAAADERIRDDISYVVSICGPTDMEGILYHAITNKRAHRVIRRVVDNSLLDGVMEAIQEARRTDDSTLLGLYKDLYLIQEMLEITDGDTLANLIDEFSPYLKDVLVQFSPVDYAQDIKTRMLLVHGTKDKLVPYEQSKRMHEAILASGGQSELMLIDGLGHIFLVRDPRKFLTYARSDGISTLNYIRDFMLR